MAIGRRIENLALRHQIGEVRSETPEMLGGSSAVGMGTSKFPIMSKTTWPAAWNAKCHSEFSS
jgi:hypothetical protein